MPLLSSLLVDIFFSPWAILSLIFWLIVLALVFLLRKKKDAAILFFPLLVMFKTKKLNKLITKISRKAPKFWKIFWTIGIFISFGFVIFAFYFFFTNFINLIVKPSPEQAVIPLIPGVTINLPVYFYLILPLLFIVTTHEFAHGIAASAEGIDVKSTGVLGAGIFFIIGFGAFVEVDERIVNSNKVKRNTRLRIAAAGTYVNGITAGIALILILCFPLMIAPFYRSVSQVNTVFKEEDGGYNYENISRGDAIIAIKKKDTSDENYIYLDELGGTSLNSILNNKTKLKCEINESLTLKIYNPSLDAFLEKNVTLGPRYYIGLYYEYTSDGLGLKITKVLSKSKGGNNFGNISAGLTVIKINGIPINLSNGDTLEKIYTSSFKNDILLNNIIFSTSSANFTLDLRIDGVVIGIYSNLYFMHKNDFAKFFTSSWPMFLYRELSWLFLIAFSITLFNMLPLPVFDGDRVVKELINWGVGENYTSIRKKKEKFYFKKADNNYELSEYRVEKINSINIIMKDQSGFIEPSTIKLSEEKFEMIDKIGDGFKDTVLLNLPEDTKLTEDTIVEISYEYSYDEKRKIKSIILNSLRAITLFIILGNFILSFVKFGGLIFWI